MPIEIQLKAFSQHGFIDLPDPALPRGAGIRHRYINPTERRDYLRERLPDRYRVGDITAQPERRAADLFCFCQSGSLVDIQQRDFSAGCGERLCCREPNCAGGAGDSGYLSSQRQFLGAAQLRLLKRPVFHIEQIGLGQRLKAAYRFGVCDGGNRSLGEIGSDLRILFASSEPE